MNTLHVPATSPSSYRIAAARAWLLPLVALAALAGALNGDDEVSISATTQTAVMGSATPGQVTISLVAPDPINPVTVYYTVSYIYTNDNTGLTEMVFGTDFTVSASAAPNNLTANLLTPTFQVLPTIPPSLTTMLTGYVTIPANTYSVTLNVSAPFDATKLLPMEKRQLVFTIVSPTAVSTSVTTPGAPAPPFTTTDLPNLPNPSTPSYVILAQSSAMIQVTEGEVTSSVTVPRPNATKQPIPDPTLVDPPSSMRGIVQVNFTNNSSDSRAHEGNLYLTAQYSGTAVFATAGAGDYTSSWKAGGLGLSNGMGFQVCAGVPGDSAITVIGTSTAASSASIAFANHPDTVYTLTGPLAGPGYMTLTLLTGTLAYAVVPGEAIIDQATGETSGYTAAGPVAGAAVSPYIEGYTGILEFSGGYGPFAKGDVFQLSTATSTAYYVVTNPPTNNTTNTAAGLQYNSYVTFRAYYDSNGQAGLNLPIIAPTTVTTLFPVTFNSGGLMNLIPVPPEATQVQLTVDPILGAPTGARYATINLQSSVDYANITPSSGTVTIADAAVVANVSTFQNATSTIANGTQGQNGIFAVTLTGGTFTTDISVPFVVQTAYMGTIPTTNATYGVDYTINDVNLVGSQYIGSVTVPAGQTSAQIIVTPLDQLASTEAVTVSLLSSQNYLLASTQDASANPTATLNIVPNVGAIQIAATTTPAVVTNPHVAGTDDGVFTISLTGPSPGLPVVVGFTVSTTGTNAAQPGVDYNIVSYPPEGQSSLLSLTTLSGSVTIPAGQTSVQIAVVPIDSFVAHANPLNVTVTLSPGIGYALNPGTAPDSATVVITPASPVVSIAAPAAGSIPLYPVPNPLTAAYSFTVSSVNGGNSAGVLPVTFTLGGTAVEGVDYSVTTNTPQANTVLLSGTSSAAITITPLPSTATTTYPKSVTVTLTSAGANPAYLVTSTAPTTPGNAGYAASMAITPPASLGYVSVAPLAPLASGGGATLATEAPAASFNATADDGVLQVSLHSIATPATTLNDLPIPVVVNFVVTSSSQAVAGTNYILTDVNGNTLLASGTTGSITIPANPGAAPAVPATADILVVPIAQSTAHQPLQLTLSLQSATFGSYTVPQAPVPAPLSVSAQAVIDSDLPTFVAYASANAAGPFTSQAATVNLPNAGYFQLTPTSPYPFSAVSTSFVLGGTAVLGTDYTVNVPTTGASGTLQIGSTGALIAITPTPTTLGGKTVTITVQPGQGYWFVTPATDPTATITIPAPGDQGYVSVAPLAPFAPGGGVTLATEAPAINLTSADYGVFQVSLHSEAAGYALQASAVPVSVNFLILSGNPSAVAGTNYTLVDGSGNTVLASGTTGTVTIPAGQTAQTIQVVPIAQAAAHQPLALTLYLEPSSNGRYDVPPSTIAALPTSAQAQIDSDQPSLIAYASGSATGPFTSQAATVTLPNAGYIRLTPTTLYPFSAFTATFALGGTAVLGTDYTLNTPASGSTGSVQVGPSGALITVTPTQTTLGDKTITLTLQPGAGYWFVTPATDPTATITVPTPGDQGLVQIINLTPTTTPAGPASATETTTSSHNPAVDDGVFEVSLPAAASIDVTVNFFATSGAGQAVAGTNYQLTSDLSEATQVMNTTTLAGSVVIPQGSTSAFIYLEPLFTPVAFSTLPVTLTIAPGSNYDVTNALHTSPSTATIPIVSTTASIVTLGAISNAVVPTTPGTFTILPTNAQGNPYYGGTPYTVTFSLGGSAVLGTDYSVTTNTGSNSTVQIGSALGSTVTITPLIDEIGTKTVTLTLQTGGSTAYLLPALPSAATGTMSLTLPSTAYALGFTTSPDLVIAGDPSPQIAAMAGYPSVASPLTGYALVTTAANHFPTDDGLLTISLPAPAAAPLDVNFIASGGTGYAVAGTNYQVMQIVNNVETAVVMNNATLIGTVQIPLGASSVQIAVVPLDDNQAHQPLPVTITLVSGPGYSTAGTTPQTIWLINQAPTLLLTTSPLTAAIAPSTPGTFQITPTNYAGQPLTVPFTLSGNADFGTDYTITITAANGTLLSTPTPASLTASIGSPSPVFMNIIPTATSANKTVTVQLQPSSSYWFVNDPADTTATMTIETGPQITRLSPAIGSTSGGTTVTITGANLTTTTGVTFGGAPATILGTPTSNTVVCNTPAGAAGAANVVLSTPLASTTATGAFTYEGMPTITSLSQTSGPVAGGTSVIITGTNLLGTSGVTFGGVAATAVTVNSQTSVTCVTPAGAAGAVNVVVTTPVGQVTASGAFSYLLGTPTIASISPAFGTVAGGTTVTITGTNLTSTSAVTFGGIPATSVVVNSATSVTCVTPVPAGAGAVTVVVTTLTSPATDANAYVYETTPTITTLSPVNGSLSGGTIVTITGTGLDGTSAVTFGGTAATNVTVVNSTSVTCTTPAGSTGAAVVLLTTPFGTATSSFNYHVQTTPNVVWANPAPIAYGTPLSALQLDAVTSPVVAGSFAYTPALGAVVAAGAAKTLSVTFTPTDTLDYANVTATATIQVTPVALTITANNQTMAVGSAVPHLTAAFSGFVNGDTQASLTTPVVLSTTANASSPAGVYPITASGATDSNYTITFVAGTLTVTAAGGATAQSASSSSDGANFFKCGNGSGVSALAGMLLLLLSANRGGPGKRSGRRDE